PTLIAFDPVRSPEKLVGFLAHVCVVHTGKSAIPLHQFLCGAASTTCDGADLGHLDPVTGHVEGFARFHLVHDESRVVTEFALGDGPHDPIVAPRVSMCYALFGISECHAPGFPAAGGACPVTLDCGPGEAGCEHDRAR